MKPTLESIAKKAGVHKSTVSRALNTPDKVSKKTREKIIDSAKDLGYSPIISNRSFKNLITDTTIAFIGHPDFFSSSDPYYPKIFRGIEKEAKNFNIHMMIRSLDENIDSSITSLIKDNKISGLIIAACELSPQLSKKLANQNIPAVTIDQKQPSPFFPSIYADNINGVKKLVRYLAKLGHQKIAFIGSDWHRSYQERFQGYLLGIHENNLNYNSDLVFMTDNDNVAADYGYQVMQEILNLKSSSTAIIGVNDMIATGVIKAIYDSNYSVPDDFSVVGFDNIEWGIHINPSLTTMSIPREEMGALALRTLVSMFGPLANIGAKRLIVPTELIERQSTGKLKP